MTSLLVEEKTTSAVDVVYTFGQRGKSTFAGEITAGRFASFFERHFGWRRVDNVAFRSHRSLDQVRSTVAVHLSSTADIPLLVGAQNVLLRTSPPADAETRGREPPRVGHFVRVLAGYVPLAGHAGGDPIVLPPIARIVHQDSRPDRGRFLPLASSLKNRRLVGLPGFAPQFEPERQLLFIPWSANLETAALRRFIEALGTGSSTRYAPHIVLSPAPGQSFKEFIAAVPRTFRADGAYPNVFLPEKPMEPHDWQNVWSKVAVLIDLGCEGDTASLYADAMGHGAMVVSLADAAMPTALASAMEPARTVAEVLQHAVRECSYDAMVNCAGRIHEMAQPNFAGDAREAARRFFAFERYQNWLAAAILE